MTKTIEPRSEIELTGIDGANPLGFLAALGTLVTLRAAGYSDVRLGWRRGFTWIPTIDGLPVSGRAPFIETLVAGIRAEDITAEAEIRVKQAEQAAKRAKTAVKQKEDEIRRLKLRGAEREAVRHRDLQPLLQEFGKQREFWLQARIAAVPRSELALGQRIDCTSEEYRQHASAACAGAGMTQRESLDFMAAFGSDACVDRNTDARVTATPFEFIKGSGHQFFLDTVGQLMRRVTAERVEKMLFEPWVYQDEKLSMRWDPFEDRRYALSENDPSGESSRTVWMANLLAYRALSLFPTAPRGNLRVTAWTKVGNELFFTWPVWRVPASADTIRSLLQLEDLTKPQLDQETLSARGISNVFRARRVKVGAGANFKFNFSPPRAVLATGPLRR